jgi:hypothetical protein
MLAGGRPMAAATRGRTRGTASVRASEGSVEARAADPQPTPRPHPPVNGRGLPLPASALHRWLLDQCVAELWYAPQTFVLARSLASEGTEFDYTASFTHAVEATTSFWLAWFHQPADG